ncbi:MAG: (2Fe-2S)-binding protein [Gemmatimonadetes bacterium]|nr:(2Fe-2S)-binding protein [Gemmatimonadota bacterium]MYH20341.1 (2Fe-2S)-binding protein [Gemmatimonadota bacterium]MYK99481.1 (2Fe-2S)-binding protein [Gemmatimonadota bacterium]
MADRHDEARPDESSHPETKSGTRFTRRGFLKGAGAGAVTAAVAPAILVSEAGTAAAQEAEGVMSATITLDVNGQSHNVEVEARTTLADALRDRLEITGPKVVCDKGECGACTVELDGKLVFSCMTLAMDAQGRKIETVEGMADGDSLHPIQEAFVEKDALMCGFCTPGFLMSSKALLDANDNPTPEEVREGLSGNICRCGTYPHVFEAVMSAAEEMRKGG